MDPTEAIHITTNYLIQYRETGVPDAKWTTQETITGEGGDGEADPVYAKEIYRNYRGNCMEHQWRLLCELIHTHLVEEDL